jgi:hypothetical protein
MKKLLLLFLLSGCASSPFIDTKLVIQNNRGSDWMLRPQREWINDNNNPRLHVVVGLEWGHQIDCPYIASGTDKLRWVHIGCAKAWGKKEGLFFEFALIHQVDSLSSWWLRTDRAPYDGPDEARALYSRGYYDNGDRWTGQNPFYHLRVGLRWKHKVKCPVIATGRSMFQGAPFESEDGAPDLYWSQLECGKRWGGK